VVEAAAFQILVIALITGMARFVTLAVMSGLGQTVYQVGSHWASFITSHAAAICANGCLNGYCSRPGDCICRKGFHGPLCDVSIPVGQSTGPKMCEYADASSSCRQG
jgi:hypothetical protein